MRVQILWWLPVKEISNQTIELRVETRIASSKYLRLSAYCQIWIFSLILRL